MNSLNNCVFYFRCIIIILGIKINDLIKFKEAKLINSCLSKRLNLQNLLLLLKHILFEGIHKNLIPIDQTWVSFAEIVLSQLKKN
jgi:hypothetical protein